MRVKAQMITIERKLVTFGGGKLSDGKRVQDRLWGANSILLLNSGGDYIIVS